MAMSENSKRVIKFLQGLSADTNITSADVAVELGMDKPVVDGVFTSSIQKKGLGYREEAEVQLEDGSHAKVKFLRVNDDLRKLDVDAAE